MVDVGSKQATRRVAIASGRITMMPATFSMVAQGHAKKGDVIGVARIAAIQATKKTSDLVPLCHPIALTRVKAEFDLSEASSSILCTVTAECYGPTGVEMEALCGVQIGLLTVYDMLKAVDRAMTIGDVRLLQKDGGKSGSYSATLPPA